MATERAEDEGAQVIAEANEEIVTPAVSLEAVTPRIGLEQYYREAGPDYAAWSPEFNMHFGYYCVGKNPLRREAMLEQMNVEVLMRLRQKETRAPQLLDLGCGLGATLRSFARRVPEATLTGVTRVPWQVEHACLLNDRAGCGGRVRILEGDYEDTGLSSESFDGVYALESSCHAHSADKYELLREAHRLLRSGGRLVVADGFLERRKFVCALQERIYRKLCDCWVIEELAQLSLFTSRLEQLGFKEILVEHLQMRVAPSIVHIPWVTVKFLITDVLAGKRAMTRARWNNVIAPALLPLVSSPFGPMSYCMISATKG